MLNGFTPQAILLDFYGTVAREDDVPLRAICQAIADASPLEAAVAEIGRVWTRVFHRMCAESFGSTFRTQREIEQSSLETVIERFGADLDGDALSQDLYDYWAHPALFPESREVLARCGVPVCLVSNIDDADLHSALAHNGLDVERIVTSEACRAYKPRGEMFERALSHLGFSCGEVLHVGDSYDSDVRGARQQGIPVLWVNRRARQLSPEDGQPDYVSADLTGLLRILEGNPA